MHDNWIGSPQREHRLKEMLPHAYIYYSVQDPIPHIIGIGIIDIKGIFNYMMYTFGKGKEPPFTL